MSINQNEKKNHINAYSYAMSHTHKKKQTNGI